MGAADNALYGRVEGSGPLATGWLKLGGPGCNPGESVAALFAQGCRRRCGQASGGGDPPGWGEVVCSGGGRML